MIVRPFAVKDAPTVAETRTDAAGRFRLEAPHAGLWAVRVEAPGFASQETGIRPLIEPVELGDVELLVGIPSYNNADTIAHVVRAAAAGLAGLLLAAGMRGIREGYELPEEADANLFEMDDAALAKLGINQLPQSLSDALRTMEQKTGKRFGDPASPLLVSCRSGSKFSMPGMMDTVLDIGLNDEVTEGMIKLTGNARRIEGARDIDDAWFTSMADSPYPGVVRDSIKSLAREVLR